MQSTQESKTVKDSTGKTCHIDPNATITDNGILSASGDLYVDVTNVGYVKESLLSESYDIDNNTPREQYGDNHESSAPAVLTQEILGEAANEAGRAMIRHGDAIEESNKALGIKADNYGNARQSPGLRKDAVARRLAGEDPYKDVGGKFHSTGQKYTTRGQGYATKEVTKWRRAGQATMDGAGTLFTLMDVADVVTQGQSPLTLIPGIGSTLVSIADDQFREMDLDMLNIAIERGYESINRMLQNSPSMRKAFPDLYLVEVDDATLLKIESGEINAIHKVPYLKNPSHAALVQADGRHATMTILAVYLNQFNTH